jgi:hypothetical protein
MKTKAQPHFRLTFKSTPMFILALLGIVMLLSIPYGEVRADSNAPTVTNTPAPSNTPLPDTATPEPAATEPSGSEPSTPDSGGSLVIPTQVPPGTPERSAGGDLSTINIILMVCLGVAVVLVIAVLVYIFIQQTRARSDEY